MSSSAYPTDSTHSHYAVFFSTKNHVRVRRDQVKETKEVCNLYPFGVHDRKKLIYEELRRRGIIK